VDALLCCKQGTENVMRMLVEVYRSVIAATVAVARSACLGLLAYAHALLVFVVPRRIAAAAILFGSIFGL
jgi:hypothetical protein